jgi:putative transposase
MTRYRLAPTPLQEAGRWHIAFAAIPGPGTSGWGLLVRRRLDDKAPGRVERASPAYTSQRCSAFGDVTAGSRQSQALFGCIACGDTGNADVNAASNIAAGHAVTARGRPPLGERMNREPQPLPLSA